MSRMSEYVSNCQKCNRPLERCGRRKVAVMAELRHGYFSANGFAMYLCPDCARKLGDLVERWCGK